MKINYIILFLFFSTQLWGQKITISGTVKDSLNNVVPYANVIAKPKDLSKNLQFSLTDNEGLYKLQLTKGDTVTVRISYLGYKPINFQFIASNALKKDFILEPSSEELDEVVIEMPVTVSGDTTTYKTDKFVDGSERKLRNVLKKLPGVEVTKDGSVTVLGKKITHMLVDGKKFFGGNSKLAVNNIPANAIGDIEVIDNYNEIAFLKGLTDSDEMAMNIKLKKDKNRFTFGDISAGIGNNDFYKTSANLFYYAPKININFIGNINNIGEQTMSFKDYLSFSGGVNAVFKGNFNFRGGDFSQFMDNKDVLTSTQKFGALNITKTASSKLDISGYIILSDSDTNNFVEDFNEYTTYTEEKTNKTNAQNLLGITNLNLEYVPNASEWWHARTQIKRTNTTNNDNLATIVSNNTNNINTNRNLTATFLNQNVEWHKRKSKHHTFSAVINYVFDSTDRNNFWSTQDPILQGLIPTDNSQDLIRLNQNRDTEQQNFDGIFKYYWEINKSNHIYTTLGNKLLAEDFLTTDQQILDNGDENNFQSDGFNNNLDFKLNDAFVGIHYKFRTGIFTFKQGAFLHNYNWNVNQQTKIHKNKWIVLPDFLAKIDFNKSRKIQLNYNLKTSFSDASRFANQFYNSVFRGNENLENNLFHSLNIRYSRFSLYRGLVLFANLSYNKQIRGVRNSVVFDTSNPNPSQQINQFLTAKLLNNAFEDFIANIHLEKDIKNIKSKLDIRYNESRFIQEVDNSIETNINRSYNYEVGLETLYEKFPTIELGINQDIGRFISHNTTSKFITTVPFAKIDYYFINGFIFNFEYRKNIYDNKDFSQKNSYEIANTSLSFNKENSAWSFKITGQNLFDARFKQSNRFSDYLVSDTKTFILPRILMFSVGYNL
ncbi:carboxypeptidase-like regulatory domain-containing protein [Winogradskyella undariae]|uniref:carboxypeptidase-like regulatory domain-containing protein n=1 Tax=Winogradskyella undariae TaxID=1285465 RepID=UPI0015CCCE6B|nr:carboxypeptidase-like regulatory domain-containing protein [Winogradskyella undariae]